MVILNEPLNSKIQKILDGRIKFDLRQQKPLIDNCFFVSDLCCIFHCFAKWVKCKVMHIAETVRFPNRNPAILHI